MRKTTGNLEKGDCYAQTSHFNFSKKKHSLVLSVTGKASLNYCIFIISGCSIKVLYLMPQTSWHWEKMGIQNKTYCTFKFPPHSGKGQFPFIHVPGLGCQMPPLPSLFEFHLPLPWCNCLNQFLLINPSLCHPLAARTSFCRVNLFNCSHANNVEGRPLAH